MHNRFTNNLSKGKYIVVYRNYNPLVPSVYSVTHTKSEMFNGGGT